MLQSTIDVSYAALRVWAANLRDAHDNKTIRDLATTLISTMDSYDVVKRWNPMIAEEIWKSCRMLESLIHKLLKEL